MTALRDLPSVHEAVYVEISRSRSVACGVCGRLLTALVFTNLIEGRAENFDLVSAAFGMPCGCRQAPVDISPDFVEAAIMAMAPSAEG